MSITFRSLVTSLTAACILAAAPLTFADTDSHVVSCFDYYRFGSVTASINPSLTNAVSGTPVTFTGTVVNTNKYPVVNGVLTVKVFRLRDNVSEKNANGPYLVDQFDVNDNISLPPGGKAPVAFSWNIPSNAKSGEYQVATFFSVDKKFNLLGLPFTDDVVGNTTRFHVSGEQSSAVEFDKDAVTVDGSPYHFASFVPEVSATSAVTVVATISNTSGVSEKVPVSWKLYQWSASRNDNLISQSQGVVVVDAHGSAHVSYDIKDTQYPVYLLVGRVTWHDTQSIINVRIARTGVDRLRINFPALSSFPFKRGENTSLFSCLHNSGSSQSVPGGRLELSLTDANGQVIHEYTYTGAVSGDMMGLMDSFTPGANYNVVNLSARLYQGGALVDSTQLTYDCSVIDPDTCLPPDKSIFYSIKGSLPGPIADNLNVIIVILVIGALLLYVWSRKVLHSQALSTSPQSVPPPQNRIGT